MEYYHRLLSTKINGHVSVAIVFSIRVRHDTASFRPGYMCELVRSELWSGSAATDNVVNTKLVRMLLTHGADVNVGYHNVHHSDLAAAACMGSLINFSCGRVIQLAMELRLFGISAVLIDHDANIDLVSPVWNAPGHECEPIPRAVHHRVTAALRKVKVASV